MTPTTRIVIIAFGSWGDVRPNVALGQALQQADYDVVVMASEPFHQWVEQHGVSFAGLSVNIQAMMDTLASDSTNVLTTIQTVNRVIGPALVQMGVEIGAVLREGDAVLASEGGLSLINGLVEKYHARLLHINLQPQAPTRDFPAMGFPTLPLPDGLRGTLNRASGAMSQRISWSMFAPRGNRLRTEHLGLPKQTFAHHRAMLEATPALILVSRHVIPQPADWPPPQRVTGYVFDADSAWEATPDLLNFLDSGDPPVYVGFGSMGDRKPEATTRIVLDAIARSGRRAILLSGWAGIGATDMPANVFLLKYAPHHWLFPRVAAVVHHGGAGTTAAGFAAGVPAVIVPYFGDQPFWAQRAYALGVGTKPIPRTQLTAEKLAAAMQEAVSNRAMQAKATDLSQKIAAEDGLGEAVKAVREFLR